MIDKTFNRKFNCFADVMGLPDQPTEAPEEIDHEVLGVDLEADHFPNLTSITIRTDDEPGKFFYRVCFYEAQSIGENIIY